MYCCCSLLDGKECAHTVHGFEVMVAASAASSFEEVEAGSNKVTLMSDPINETMASKFTQWIPNLLKGIHHGIYHVSWILNVWELGYGVVLRKKNIV